jgi:hypothetical protein
MGMKSIKLPEQRDYPRRIYFAKACYRLRFKKSFDCYGETNFTRKTVTIRAGLGPMMLLTTFLHEVLHIFEHEYPIKMKHKTVYKLERAFFEFLVDNYF